MSESTIDRVVLEKVYAAKARTNYVELLGDIAPPKLEEVVSGMEHFFAACGKELSQCDTCGGFSAEELTTRCPYCDEGEATPSEESASAAPAISDIQCPAPASSSDQAGHSMSRVGVSAIEAGASMVATSTDLVTVSTTRPLDYFANAEVNEKALDEITAAIRSFDRTTSACTWILGRLVDQAERFWQQRKGENGTPKYKSFDRYCEEELDMSGRHVNRLRKVAREYTREQVEAFGTTKLYVLLALVPKERDAFLEIGATKASTPELQAAIDHFKASREAEPAADMKKRAETAMKDAKKAKATAKKSRPTPRQKTKADKAEIARQVARTQAELDAMNEASFTYGFRAKKDTKQLAALRSGTREAEGSVVQFALYRDANGRYLASENGEHGDALRFDVDPADYGYEDPEEADE